MASLQKWSRMYLKTSHNRGETVLLIAKLHPRRRGCGQWTYVSPNRTVSFTDTKDRSKIHARKQTGVDYADFPALSRFEKRDVEDKSRDLILRADNSTPGAWKKLAANLTLVRNTLLAFWAGRAWGTSGILCFMVWRVAVFLDLWFWLRWAVEKVEDLHDMVNEVDDFRRYTLDLWERGMFEIPIMVVGSFFAMWFMAGGPSFLSGTATPPRSPTASDVDSDGFAGHEVDSSGDESTEQLKHMMKTLVEEVRHLGRSAPSAKSSSASPCTSQSDRGSGASAGAESHSEDDASTHTPRVRQHHVDRMIARLHEFEKGIALDRAAGSGSTASSGAALVGLPPPGLTGAAAHSGAPPGSASSIEAQAGSADGSSSPIQPMSKSWIDLGPLKEAMEDPKQRLVENLERLKEEPLFSLPANVKERVAPGLLVQIYTHAGSAVQFAKEWIHSKELEKNHVGHEMLLHCMTLDRMIRASPDFIATEGCEIICSRIYALRRAFQDVHSQQDWKQPKGQSAAKWRSKVRWDLANEIDWRSHLGGDDTLPNVEKDIQERLQVKAMFNKYLTKASSGKEDANEDN